MPIVPGKCQHAKKNMLKVTCRYAIQQIAIVIIQVNSEYFNPLVRNCPEDTRQKSKKSQRLQESVPTLKIGQSLNAPLIRLAEGATCDNQG